MALKEEIQAFIVPICFYLIQEDDSCTDISFTKIFRVDGDTDDVLESFMKVVVPSIEAFRMTFRPFTYEGIICVSLAVDIDHYDLKFRELASIWIEQNGGVDSLVKKSIRLLITIRILIF